MTDLTKGLSPDMRQEIATIQRDPWSLSARLKWLLNEDPTLLTRGGSKGLRIYDELERDARVYATLRKRKQALLAFPYQIDPASDSPADQAAAELVTQQLASMNFRETCLDLQDAVLKGFAISEILWELVDGRPVIRQSLARDQRRFVFGQGRELRMRDWTNMWDGHEMPARKFIVHRVGGKDGSPYGHGLGSILFWLVLFKRQGLTFWLTFLDKFGSPTAVGKYPIGVDEEGQQKLLNSLFAIAQDAGIIIPNNVEIELLEAQRPGSVDAYERLARYIDEEITLAVLGETLSTSLGDVGSQAATSVHDGVRLELVQGDGELLAATLNDTLIRWIVEANLPNAQPPKIKFLVDQEEDLTKRAQRDQIVQQMGFKPTLEYIQETYGGDWTEPPPVAAPEAPPANPAFAEPNTAARDASTVDTLVGQAADLLDPITSAAIDAVQQALADSDSLGDFQTRLAGLAATFQADKFAAIMEQALSASHLAGRADVDRGQ